MNSTGTAKTVFSFVEEDACDVHARSQIDALFDFIKGEWYGRAIGSTTAIGIFATNRDAAEDLCVGILETVDYLLGIVVIVVAVLRAAKVGDLTCLSFEVGKFDCVAENHDVEFVERVDGFFEVAIGSVYGTWESVVKCEAFWGDVCSCETGSMRY